jgi:hypothetical protein
VTSHFGLWPRSKQLNIGKPFLKCARVSIGAPKVAIGHIRDPAVGAQQILNSQLVATVSEIPARSEAVR